MRSEIHTFSARSIKCCYFPKDPLERPGLNLISNQGQRSELTFQHPLPYNNSKQLETWHRKS